MKIFQKYIAFNYIKNFLILCCSLEIFFVSIDLLANYKKLPESANLQLLYTVFKSMDAINYTLPLSLIFAMIITKFSMIRSNELITLYSVSITKKSVVQPLFFISLFITFIYIGLNFSNFAYSYEYSKNLLKYNVISNSSTGLFLKDKNQYIYFETLDPIKKKAEGIKIFEIYDNDLHKVISAEKGFFYENRWVLNSVKITTKPRVKNLEDQGLKESLVEKYETLDDFKPKIIDNVHEGKYTLSTFDAIDAFRFFNEQGINADRIKTIIYSQLFFPLFAPLLLVVLFYKLPISSRYSNFALLSFAFILTILIVWGVLFLLSKLAYSSVIIPEIAVLLPILILSLVSLKYYTSSN